MAPARETRGYVIERLPPEKLRLSGAASSLDDLLRTVERSLAESDTTSLMALMVAPVEYRDILFPAFPASHPPIDADFPSIWVMHYTDAHRGMKRIVREYGGHDVHIQRIWFDDPGQDFGNFVLDETSHVDITVDGELRHDVKLVGSVFHVGDQWKVLSYPEG